MTTLTSPARGFHRSQLLWPMLAALLILGWSSGFVGIRYANEEASIALLLFWRTLLSGLILLPFALACGPRMRASAVLYQMGFGVMAVFLYLGGFSVAIEQRVPTGLVALISDLLPLAIAALSQPMLGERLSHRQWLGTFVAVGGVLIVSIDSLGVGNAPLWAYALTVGSMLIFAFASVLHRGQKRHRMPVYQSLCIHSLTGAALFGLSSLALGDGLAPPMTRGFAIGMAWLVILGTFVSYFVYYIALRLYPAAKVSAAIYLAPPVTMIWAWFLFDDPLTSTMFIGLAVTMVGVLLTTTSQKTTGPCPHSIRD
ncbi:DMT family transporter [Shimia sp. R9_3]|uniref:DMT family transporter n=1 Tax=Shimia sp. R9_3 TaxID=2821113 RepID=UPI001ADA00AD|nr:DMT family transporter [Shimia sp. R9_3]MBO9401179.1 DMT family transporter [Shimia sp. R9_3]